MLEVTPHIAIPEDAFSVTYARSGGPGGQNVNKVSSKVHLRWNPETSPHVPEDIKARFLVQQKHRLTKEGDLLIVSQKTRDQGKNYEDCLEKLKEMILAAVTIPKKRKKTRPTKGSIERRLTAKKKTAERKSNRRPSSD